MNLPYSKKNAIILGLCVCFFLSACGGNKDVKYAQLLKKYDEYLAADKVEEARLSIQSAIDIKPKEADPYYKLAEVLLRQGKFPAALENYRSAINYNPKHRDARYRLGSLMLAAKDYESAEDNTERILAENPQDVDALILKANIASSSTRKDYVAARKILQDVLAKDSKNVNALASLGMIALQQDETKEAEAKFLEALEYDPKSVPLRLVLTDLYAKQGRLDESQKLLEEVVADDPKNSTVRYGFAEFLLKRGLGGKAEEQYSETLKADPLRHDARDRLFDVSVARREMEKARAYVQELQKNYPENPGTQYFEGRLLELEGKIPQALEKYLICTKGLTTFAPAFRRAALIQLSTGEDEAGLDNLNKAVAVDPGDVPARLELARRAYLNKKFAEASEQVNQVLARFPRHLSAHVMRADIALAEGQFAEARKVYRFLVENFPQSPQGFAKLGVLEEREGHVDQALALYKKVLSFDINVLLVANRYAKLLVAQHGVEAAEKEIERLEKASKNSQPEYWYILAGLQMANEKNPDRVKRAKEYLLRVVEQRPSFSGAYFALGSLDSAQGDKEAAAKSYEKVAAANPKHIPSRVLLASIREQQGKVDEASRLYREILSIDQKVGIAANNLAWILAEKPGADLDEALRFAQLAKERMPDSGEAADTLGWVHFKRGSIRVALPFLQEAIQLNEKNESKQSNPIIFYHIAEVQLALQNPSAAREAAQSALSGLGEKHPNAARLQQIVQDTEGK